MSLSILLYSKNEYVLTFEYYYFHFLGLQSLIFLLFSTEFRISIKVKLITVKKAFCSTVITQCSSEMSLILYPMLCMKLAPCAACVCVCVCYVADAYLCIAFENGSKLLEYDKTSLQLTYCH